MSLAVPCDLTIFLVAAAERHNLLEQFDLSDVQILWWRDGDLTVRRLTRFSYD